MIMRQFDSWPLNVFPSTFSELERIRRDLGRLITEQTGGDRLDRPAGVFPLMNVSQDQENFYIRSEIPGMNLDDLDISIIGRGVTVSGERKISHENGNVRYHRREREGGKFRRQFNLPMDIDADRVQAKYRHGILMVVLPKAASAKPKKIPVSG